MRATGLSSAWTDARRPVSVRGAVAIAAVGVAALIASWLAPPARVFSLPDRGDIAHYFDYAQRTSKGQVPYRDFMVEYPPAALPVLLGPWGGDHGYFTRFRGLMLGIGVAAIVLIVVALFLVGASVADLLSGVLVLATLPLFFPPDLVSDRFDLWPAVLVLLAVVALLLTRRRLGLAALTVGAGAKLYPLVLVPLAILTKRGRAHVPGDLTVVWVVSLVILLPFAVIAPRGLGHVGWVLARRPLHVESLGGSMLLVAHRLGIYDPKIYLSFAGSWDLAGPAAIAVAVICSLLEAAALVAVWYLFSRTARGPRDLLLAVVAVVVGFVAFGKVFSPQYVVWIAAAVPLALGRVRPLVLAGTVGVALITRYVYDTAYYDLLAGGGTSWVMFGRNLILVAMFCLLVAELATRARATTAVSSDVGATAT